MGWGSQNQFGGSAVMTASQIAALVLASSITNGDTTHAPDGNSVFDAIYNNFRTQVTAAGTTTLVATDAIIQEFTGTTTQTVVLPVVSTLTPGRPFLIINNSTGIVTVNSSGGNLVQTVPADSSVVLTCVLITGTAAASWQPGVFPKIDSVGNLTLPNDAGLFGGIYEIVRYSSGGGNFLWNAGGNRPQTIRLQGNDAGALLIQETGTGNALGLFRTDTDTFSTFKGGNVASAAAIVPTGNTFHVTGTTTITSITATNISAGTTIVIIFDGVLTFTAGGNLKLQGDFVTSADASITLKYDGTNWYECARSLPTAAAARAALGVPTILSAVLQADFPKTNDTLANVTDLTLNLIAGRWYQVTLEAFALAGNPTGGWQMDFAGGSATATGLKGFGRATPEDDPVPVAPAYYMTALNVPMLNSLDVTVNFSLCFTIQVDTGGTLIVRFAQDTTDAAASNLLKYSTIQAIDVTP